MRLYLRLFSDLMLLRAAPQDVPASRFLFWCSLALMTILALAQGAFIFPPLENLAFNAFDLVLLLLFVHFLLSFTGHLPRFLQTMTALFGVSVLFRLVQLPAYIVIKISGQNPANPFFVVSALFMMLLLMYNLFVMGHIFRHALSVSMTAGVMIALAYVVVNYTLMGMVFSR